MSDETWGPTELRADMARLEVRRRARKALPQVTPAELETAIEECLSP